jgi:peptide/nickel transport system substrate-binding protein
MRSRTRAASLALLALSLATAVGACGAGDKAAPQRPIAPGSITILMGTPPDFLDPQLGSTPQAGEPDWIVYTPLLTYRHASGRAGGEVIPGLAAALPRISKSGRTYTLTLRKDLHYSDGSDVKASDFAYSIERAIKLEWGGKSFYTAFITGAAAYDKGSAQSISGITTDDASGRITIRLTQPYGAFPNVLAFPSSGLVPSGTPMKDLSNDPPPGVGPYRIASTSADGGFTLEQAPGFAAFHIHGIPTGSIGTIKVKIVSDPRSEAQQVLHDRADVFDPGDALPAALVKRIEQRASHRFTRVAIPSTSYFFLNTARAPFDQMEARQAVDTAIDRKALARRADGFLKPSCWLIPVGIPGHSVTPCPYGRKPNLAKARRLLRHSGELGAHVTVWGPRRSPQREYVNDYTAVLNAIGFHATEKLVADADYARTVGDAKTSAQTGFAERSQDFPNPNDFYQAFDERTIQPTHNENPGNVRDDGIQQQITHLSEIPESNIDAVDMDWAALDVYVVELGYLVPLGSSTVPELFSKRLDFGAAIFHPIHLNDWSSLRLK